MQLQPKDGDFKFNNHRSVRNLVGLHHQLHKINTKKTNLWILLKRALRTLVKEHYEALENYTCYMTNQLFKLEIISNQT